MNTVMNLGFHKMRLKKQISDAVQYFLLNNFAPRTSSEKNILWPDLRKPQGNVLKKKLREMTRRFSQKSSCSGQGWNLASADINRKCDVAWSNLLGVSGVETAGSALCNTYSISIYIYIHTRYRMQ